MTEPTISFIIPAYRAENWLPRCVSAICEAERRSPMPIEILLCDDCSPDGTGALADRLATEDPRIIVLHNEKNGGVCHSRNRCLERARGTWICFVDQDDVLDQNAFRVFAATLEESADILYYGFEDFYEENALTHGDGQPGEARVFSPEEIRKLQWDCLCRYRDNIPLISYRLLPVPWGKLYRRDFLNEYRVRFREGLHREEDIGFNFIALAHCRRAVSHPYPLYHYRKDLHSQSHTFRPKICRETDATLAWYREIMARDYPGDPRMEELYRFRCLWGTLYNIALGCIHAGNPAPYAKRKAEFLALFRSETLPAGDALDPAMIRRLAPYHRILATLARRKAFFLLSMLGKLTPLAYKFHLI